MFFQVLGSSSSGNCSYLECDGVKAFIDAGLGIKRIRKYLAGRGLDIEDIDAVFVTHEHFDHYASLCYFAAAGTKIYANRGTAECIRYKDSKTKNANWQIFETGQKFDFYGIDVLPFTIPHDTTDPVGYSFTHQESALTYATDIGKVTNSVQDFARNCSVLVLESNYCPLMLARSNRPPRLKNRISSTSGHLSNADAISLLKALPPVVKKVYLTHVSRECNSVSHIAELLGNSGIDSEMLRRIEIVSPFDAPSSPVEF